MLKTLRTFNYHKEQMKLLFNSQIGAFSANIIAPLIFLYIYNEFIPLNILLIWVTLQAIGYIFRVYISKKALKILDTADKQVTYKYLKQYLYVIFINSFLWGIMGIVVLLYTTQFYVIFYFTLIFALTAGAISTIGVVYHAIFIFLLNNIGLNIIALLITGTEQIHYTLAFIIFLYFIAVVSSSFKNYKAMSENIKQKEIINKSYMMINDSIEYASLIQYAILPNKKIIDSVFKNSFVFWQPKNIVGGDIYFINKLNENEMLIMVIDGAGHGVPGAFVTMLVKAIERQIIAEINSGKLKPSPALILEYFNKSIKSTLKEDKDSKSNTGFDGGILYYNKETNSCKYAGAKTPLYIINNKKLDIIKSDRKNVGFIRTKKDQKYTDHEVTIKKGTKLYIATDGIIDQEGKNNSRYGKSKFQELLLNNSNKPFIEQYRDIKKSFIDFKNDCKQSDDITIIGFEFL